MAHINELKLHFALCCLTWMSISPLNIVQMCPCKEVEGNMPSQEAECANNFIPLVNPVMFIFVLKHLCTINKHPPVLFSFFNEHTLFGNSEMHLKFTPYII